jgi:O-acetyl-ADP-ribose deacetylase (regulator of RNase III)
MPSTNAASPLAAQLPYAVFIIVLFLGYSNLVRRGTLAGRNIVLAGAVVGLIAAAASFFQVAPETRAQTALPVLLVGPFMMLVCTAVCVAFAYRAQKVVEAARFTLGDTTVIVRYSPASRIEADALLLPALTTLRMLGGVPGALRVAGGPDIEREALRAAPVNPGKVVMTGAGRLAVDHVFHAAVGEPLRPVDAGVLRRALEGAAQQARKAGAETIALPVGSLRGLGVERVAAVAAEALLKQRRAFSEIIFVALDVRSTSMVAAAVSKAVEAVTARPRQQPANRSSETLP